MIEYTLGIATNDDFITLVRKNRPSWQAGCLNFIGGKVEPGEAPVDCISREFQEETGVKIYPDYWKYIGCMFRPEAPLDYSDLDAMGTLHVDGFKVYIYAHHSNKILEVETKTDEVIVMVQHDDMYAIPDLVSNARTFYEFSKSPDCIKQGATLTMEYPIES